jgi:hypothetical protein
MKQKLLSTYEYLMMPKFRYQRLVRTGRMPIPQDFEPSRQVIIKLLQSAFIIRKNDILKQDSKQ